MKSILCFAFLLGLAAFDSGSAADSKPNVVFILADDSGFADFGCYGHPYARTPNIDKLASEGTRFRQFYSTGVTCCPARTGLMTSRWPASYATYPANGGFGDRVTITELLKKQGYATGHFGKWHIGPDEKNGTYGIDVTGAEDKQEGKRKQGERGRDAHIYDEAIKFLEEHKDGPFYLNVWSHVSHHPINPPPAYVDKFKDLVVDESKFSEPMQEKFTACKARGGDVSEHMRRYLAEIFSLDEDVGRLLKRLDELGLRDNTIVVFSSDQGPAPIRESEDKEPSERKARKRGKTAKTNEGELDIRLSSMGYSGGLRGGKHGMDEGGVRVPFIVRWPGHVSAGRVDEKSVISGIDWLPTLCHLAGVKIDAKDFEGEDVSDAWLGKEHARTRPLLWKTSTSGSEAGIREGQWKLIHSTRKRGETELYDIAADPGEKNNVASQHPEIVKKLTTKVESWVATLPKEYIKTEDKDL
jgi:N-acetylgalactosamine-6-sulfatase